MEEKFIEFKVENEDIAFVIARLSNAEIGKLFS